MAAAGLVLELRGISKRFRGVQALTGIDLTIRAGEVHCLAGENGSGKSTLIKIIAGVQPPEPGGQIVIDGVECPGLSASESIRRGIQVIYQDLSLFPNLTVAENIAVAQHLRPGLVRWQRIRRTAEVAMHRLGIELDPQAFVADLPIAQRQLVAICRAMAAEARLVIMDEPTASLSRHEVDALLALTRQLKQRGIAVVFVSHRLDEVLEVSDRVTVLRNGEKIGTYDAAGMTDRRLGEMMIGRHITYEMQAAAHADAEVVLAVEGLTRAGEFADVTLSIRRGEIVGLTGRLGSGRTELALSLFGMNAADAGRIEINGRALKLNHTTREAVAAGIAYVPEDRLTLGLAMRHSIASNLLLATLPQLGSKLGLVADSRRAERTQFWIDKFGIKAPKPEHAVGTLSGGNQQRVVLARWLAAEPRLLILDSPTVGVDIGAKEGIYQMIRQLAADGFAVLMISDEIPEVFYHAHRVLVMRRGRITSSFTPALASESQVRIAVDA
jgi:simple sugar transport system ATP-binding protein